MYRWFLPIGQGGFAIEEFGSNNMVVFDCGSETKLRNKNIIEERIEQTFLHEKKRISKVFISHFHRDHFNGLPFLLKYCHVDNIFLPYLTKSEQVIALILLSEEINSQNGLLFQSLITGSGWNRLNEELNMRITYVHPVGDQMIPDKKSGREEHIYSGYEIKGDAQINNDQWVFIPCIYSDEQRSEQFKAFLQANGIGDDICEKIRNQEFWKNKKLKGIVRKAYEKINKKINLTNMIVYSGTKKSNPSCYITPMKYMGMEGFGSCCSKNSGCLYMGDYDTTRVEEWKTLKSVYKEVWEKISVCTVPHHGSIYNFNQQLTELKAVFVINAGCNNKHGHPDREVLELLQNNGKTVFWVNELDNTSVIILYKKIIK